MDRHEPNILRAMSVLLDSASAEPPDLAAQLVANYRPLPGVYDEMVDSDGVVREHWRELLTALAALGRDELSRRFAATDRYLRDSGVFYRVYEDNDGIERPWPLTPIPLMIEAGEWAKLETALIERAHLIETVTADIYGEKKLFRENRLPGAFVAGSPEFLRPLVDVPPPGGAHLRFYAVDIARGPDGGWWVLRDRTQAPSGAGYALENRLALSHGIPDIYRRMHVHRHAPFFQALQAELTGLNRQDDSRVCVLTPGPLNETYFEHAYLARYLGFLLVEGADLTVRDNGVFIRTVSGLKRTEVLLRRLDADYADPLELNARSRLGVPGLVQAVRDGKVVLANGLGSGVAEARGMLAFLPALSRAIDGHELAMPNVATWWLGDPAVRAATRKRFDEMVVASAFSGDLPSEILGDGVLGSDLGPRRRLRILQSIEDRGVDVVLQEAVRLSTMPVWLDGKLEPRPFILRVFLSRIGDTWSVMPGGFVRIGEPDDVHAISLQRGALTADVWIPSNTPIVETTLLPNPDRMQIRRAAGTLPSRAADNLFWLGRYIERTEATLRLVRALLTRMSESDSSEDDIEAITSLIVAWEVVPEDLPVTRPIAIARAALQRGDHLGSIPALANAARATSAVIRDRLSPDAWQTLTRLVATCEAALGGADFEAAMTERVEAALRIIASFSGLAQENMTRLGGWRFLELGRRIERAIATCRFIRQFGGRLDRGLDILLELADSRITYRQRYVMVAARAPVIDLTLLDPSNPRSVAFQFDQIEQHLAALPHMRADGRLSLPRQISMATAAKLRTADAARVDDALILTIETALLHLSEAISSTFLGRTEPVETREELLS
jgi:uncharacterized circularly permuted ATP-grasp superfamily protein/uncharacterized alpha-E superfamily protein